MNNPTEHQRLVERIRTRRTALGLSQTDLARLVGCDRKTINSIETSHRSPSIMEF